MWMILPVVALGVIALLEIRRAEQWKKRAKAAENAFKTLAKVHNLYRNAGIADNEDQYYI